MRESPRRRRYQRRLGSDPVADAEDELQTHIASRVDDLVSQGRTEPEARAQAEREFGDMARIRSELNELGRKRRRRERRARRRASLGHDLRYALRLLRTSPRFAAVVVLTLALGIGLSTAVFTVADALLIRRLPVVDQDRLLLLWGEARDGRFSKVPLTLDDVREFERRSQSLGAVAFLAFRGAVQAPIEVDGRVDVIEIGLVSGSFFEVLGTRAALGRGLRPEDDVEGAAPVVVLSYRAWQQRFGGDSTIVGRSVGMPYAGRRYTIVGVMPKGIDHPRDTDVWAPLVAYGAAGGFLEVLSGELDVLARLRPRATVSQARSELTTYLGRPAAPSWQRNVRGVARPVADVMLGDTKPAVILVALAAGLLLLLTCVNIANLLLVRSLGRVREMAVRSALGAGRGRVLAQLLTESGLLALAGGVLGTVLAAAAVKLLAAYAPSSVPRVDEVAVNGAMLGPALIITTVTVLLSAAGPALFTSRVEASDALRSGFRHSRGRRVRTLAEALVVAQVALATVSLTAAGLVTRSFIKLQHAELAFEPEHLLAIRLLMQPDQLADAQSKRRALDMALLNTAALPDLRDVTPVFTVPFVGDGGGVDGRVATPMQSEEERATNPIVNMEVAAPNYFALLGVPLLHGRFFNDDDGQGSDPVVVISRSVARHFWPGADPIGKQLRISEGIVTVVGVVADTRYRELRTAWPTVYFPFAQSPLPPPSTLLIRTSGTPAAVIPAVRRAVSEVHGVAVMSASPIETLLDAPRAQPRLNALVLVLFAAAAVSLAAIGLFAVIATMVRQRTHELGIRMVLGATSGHVRGMILMRGFSIAAVGAAIGLGGAFAARRLLSALMFEMSPTDGTTLVGVAALMLSAATIATFIPARLSMRADPVIALRSE